MVDHSAPAQPAALTCIAAPRRSRCYIGCDALKTFMVSPALEVPVAALGCRGRSRPGRRRLCGAGGRRPNNPAATGRRIAVVSMAAGADRLLCPRVGGPALFPGGGREGCL